MTDLQQTVQRLIKQYGTRRYVLRKVSDLGLVDPSNPSKGSNNVSQDYPMWSFPDNSRGFKGFLNTQKDGELIKEGDILLHVETTGLSVVPEVSDKVVEGTSVWNIKNIYTYESSDTVALYSLHIRK